MKYLCLFTILFITNNAFANGLSNETDLQVKNQTNQSIAKHKLLGFQENKGQMTGIDNKPADYVLFKVDIPGLNIWVTKTGLTYQFLKTYEKKEPGISDEGNEPENNMGEEKDQITEWRRVDMILKGASIKKENIITEGNVMQGEVNYYLGQCPDGIFNVKTYRKVTICEIHSGIDWVLYTSSDGNLKHDFIVHPKADPSLIKIVYEGMGKIKTKADQIEFKNDLGEIQEGKLLCYQGNASNVIPSNYITKKNQTPLYSGAGILQVNDRANSSTNVKKRNSRSTFSYEIGIELKQYNKALPLIIDPQLVWATFFGGSGSNGVDGPMSITNDNMGNVFAAGYSDSPNFPTISSGGYYQGTLNGGINVDVFILKFDNSGILLWATYYGGSSGDWGHSISMDAVGNIYITGRTASSDFPVTGGAFQGTYAASTPAGGYDAFILKFTNAGTRLWATYYGGNGSDIGNSITTDTGGNIFITGSTQQVTFGGNSFPVFNSGNFFQAPGFSTDVFIIKFSAAGVRLWATVYGGSSTEEGYAIATDNSNNIFITGHTQSANFPVCNSCPGYFDGVNNGDDVFILKFSNTGVRLWATFYGGTLTDIGKSIATDNNGNLFVTGWTNSSNFPLLNAGTFFQGTISGGPINSDAFLLKFNNTGTLLWSTYYGGSGNDYANVSSFDNIAVDACGAIYISFESHSGNLLTQAKCSAITEYYDSSPNGMVANSADIVIAHFSNSGALIWATYWGGDGNEYRSPLTVDPNGNLFVSGEWMGSNTGNSLSYPLTNPGGGAYYQSTFGGGDDGSFAKFTPSISSFTQSQINSSTCNPCNGSATINLTCSEPNYNYTWSNGVTILNNSSATNAITGLCPGTYTVTVTSNCNQTQTTTFVITGTQCGCLNTATVATTPATCGNSNGTAKANPTNGNAPYTYLWSSGHTTQTATGLSAGNYSVTVTDAGSCTATVTSEIISPPALSGQFTKGTADCSICGCKEWIMINATGGTSPYSYSWPDGYAIRYRNQLCPGAYTVNVKDKNGCSVNVNLTAP
ncbi:MAG: SBBP repeat-containing protein [Bacteroidia bacterium]|nr:SBBP repeat-containing protein [Bacteroidia bacterium]